MENPNTRSESRPNAIGTNGALSILVSTEQVPVPWDSIRDHWKEISLLSGVSKLLGILRDSGPGPAFSESSRPPKGMTYLDNYCAMAISDTLVRIERGKELENWSQSLAGKLLQSMEDPLHHSAIIAPLVNFYAESALPISLTDNVRIRLATDDEIEEFGNRKTILGHSLTALSGFVRFLPVLWVAETEWTWPPDDGLLKTRACLELDASIAALRVLGDQFFDYPMVSYVEQPYNHASSGQPNPTTPAFQRWLTLKGPFILHSLVVEYAKESVKRVVPQLVDTAPNPIKIAVTRLRRASTREIESEMVVDGVIAMEAVLLRDNERWKSFRLATRSAVLTADAAEDRIKVYNLVSKLNVARGDFVHGRDETTRGVSSEEILSLARKVVRRVVDETARRSIEDLIGELVREANRLSKDDSDPLGRIIAGTIHKGETA
ncbi:MAG: hypothetical protein ACYC7D_15900 [Nitrososphaerales archaeon]